MEEKKNNKVEESGNYGGLFLFGALVTIKTIFKRKKFIEFIDAVKFKLRIKSLDKGKAILHIMPLTSLNVPYNIRSIDVLYNKENLAATNSSCDLNSRIVANSNIDIVFNVLSPDVTENILENSELAITYSFLGFSYKRLYKPLKIVSNNSTTVVGNSTACGCTKK
ncbi:hypothetical protein ACOSP6_11025 [Tenacibaculum sp. MEBiC06402]|uniref:hypothetical protein n=1 Tax=unclassified Tenacibaculum TaxID=2635139 RepID=UPI003B995226